MKLDYDLIRSLLLKIEADSIGIKVLPRAQIFSAFPEEGEVKVDYHLKYLLDAQLIEGESIYKIVDITPIGREYLDNIRNGFIWQRTKQYIQPLGSVALPVVSKVAGALVLRALGL